MANRNAKDALIAALDSDFSQALKTALTRTLPTIAVLSLPTTLEEAIIATGKVNVNFNNQFLVPFSGLPLFEMLLKAGQLNKTFQTMLLASLEYCGVSGITSTLSPIEGGIYYGWFDDWKVSIERSEPESVSVTCNEQTEALSKGKGGLWGVKFPIPIGKHAATIAATFQGGQPTQETVNFEVKHWEDMPVSLEGDTLTIDSGDSTPMIETCEIEINGQRFQVSKAERQMYLKLQQDILEQLAVTDQFKAYIRGKGILPYPITLFL